MHVLQVVGSFTFNKKPLKLLALALALIGSVHLVLFLTTSNNMEDTKLSGEIFDAYFSPESEPATDASGTNATTKQTRFITVEMLIGRLGNNFFQYASMYGVARRYGFSPVLRSQAPLLARVEARQIRAQIVPDEQWYSATAGWPRWCESRASSYNQTELEAAVHASIIDSGNLTVGTYLQSYRYFQGYEAEVVSQFVFSQAVRDWAFAVLQNVTSRVPRDKLNWTVVGVHIRRGDYLQQDMQSKGYNTPGEAFYIEAVRYFTTRYDYVAFIVSSNDIQWASEFFRRLCFYNPQVNESAIFELTDGAEDWPERDLAVLSLANHSVLSAGSYSFWAAMLRQYRNGKPDCGTTIYYTRPFIADSEIGQSYGNSVEYFYPPDWIGLD